MGIKNRLSNIPFKKTNNGTAIKLEDYLDIIPIYLNGTNWVKDTEMLEQLLIEINSENIMIIGDVNARVGREQVS